MLFNDAYGLSERKMAPLSGFGRIMRRSNLDGPLLGGLLLTSTLGLIVLYSAVAQDFDLWLQQCVRLVVALIAMFIVAQLPPDLLRRWTPWGYLFGLILLVLVLSSGDVGQGAQRWLNIGIRFQPSEIMKLAVPMMAAWYLHNRQLPPKFTDLVVIGIAIVVPTVMIAVQPDLGTSLLIAASGVLVIILAGLSIRVMLFLGVASIPGAYVLWHFMQDYQKQRVLTLLNPDSDPLGAGYNIIQS
jgi:rod shape determining protein RodA